MSLCSITSECEDVLVAKGYSCKKLVSYTREKAPNRFGVRDEEPPIVQATYNDVPTPMPYVPNEPAPVYPYPVATNTTTVSPGNLDTSDSFRNSEKQQKKKCNGRSEFNTYFLHNHNVILFSIKI